MKPSSSFVTSLFLLALTACTAPTVNNTAQTAQEVSPESNLSFEWGQDDREPASADSAEKLKKCVKRVKLAGCDLSNNNIDRIEDNVMNCRQLKSSTGSTILEVFLLRDAGKIVVMKTKGQGVSGSECPVTKYTLKGKTATDLDEVDEFKVLGTRVFFRGKRGAVFFMYSDQTMYEILNSNKKSYTTTTSIKGVDGQPGMVQIDGAGFSHKVDAADIAVLREKGRIFAIEFRRSFTDRSLFRDE